MSVGNFADDTGVRGALQYVLFSGIAWFVAGAVFFTAVLLRRERLAPVSRILILLAIGIGALSGTPLKLWLAIPVSGAMILCAFRRRSPAAALAASILVAIALVAELRFFIARPLETPPKRVVVIGDSISSGGFGEVRTWSELLGLPALNLAMASDTVESALRNQAPQLATTDADLVFLQIGGNDMLSGTPPGQFRRDLDALIRVSKVERRNVVMFELPILPGRWAYGAAQRAVARKHGVGLIPKRALARVLTASGATSDGLHLTQRGHDLLAAEVRRALFARAPGNR